VIGEGVDGERLLARQCVATELEHGTLANLYVASTRLQATLRSQEVLAAIREILINLIGVEEFAVFENDAKSSTLSLIDCCGTALVDRSKIPLGEGPIGQIALTGDCRFRDADCAGQQSGDVDIPLACVPLKMDGTLWGVIVILRLLPQKQFFEARDYQLIELLSRQAGVALCCAKFSDERTAAKESQP
jgi:GAF domain-containing protein